MVDKLAALEEFARMSNWHEVADLLRIARRTTVGDLRDISTQLSANFRDYEDNWFEEAIDQLTRHAHERGMPQVETLLIKARAAWDTKRYERADDIAHPNSTETH